MHVKDQSVTSIVKLSKHKLLAVHNEVLKHCPFISGDLHCCCQGKQVSLQTSNPRCFHKRHQSYRDWFPGSYRHPALGQVWSFSPWRVKRGDFSVIFQPRYETFLYWKFRRGCSRGKLSSRCNNVIFGLGSNWLCTPIEFVIGYHLAVITNRCCCRQVCVQKYFCSRRYSNEANDQHNT